MNTHEMMERFRQFASADLSFIIPNRMHQVSEVLLKTDVVRIILTRYDYRTESLDVDVEVSLPLLPATSGIMSTQEYIDSVITTLEYLKRLIFNGFGLEVLQEEGILVASAALSLDTREHVFKALKPPD